MDPSEQTDSHQEKPRRDKPGIRIVPPKLAAQVLVAGVLLNFLIPLRPFDYWTSFFLGFFLAAGGAALVVWSIRTFAVKGTNVRIDEPALTIVTSGPYAFSRNPIYVGGAILYTGLALLFNSGWAVLFLVPLMATLYKQVILREESYLEKKFGQTYLDYKAEVRRWI